MCFTDADVRNVANIAVFFVDATRINRSSWAVGSWEGVQSSSA